MGVTLPGRGSNEISVNDTLAHPSFCTRNTKSPLFAQVPHPMSRVSVSKSWHSCEMSALLPCPCGTTGGMEEEDRKDLEGQSNASPKLETQGDHGDIWDCGHGPWGHRVKIKTGCQANFHTSASHLSCNWGVGYF